MMARKPSQEPERENWIASIATIWVVAIPLAVMATLILKPFWQWLDQYVDVYSEKGASPLCYVAAYIVISDGWLLIRWLMKRRKP